MERIEIQLICIYDSMWLAGVADDHPHSQSTLMIIVNSIIFKNSQKSL